LSSPEITTKSGPQEAITFDIWSSEPEASLTPTMVFTSRASLAIVSVIANIVPRETADLVHAALDGDWKRARDLHYRLFPLARAAFLETNPIPIKEAMAMAGMIEPEFRLPMCRMSDANREKLRAILKSYSLVK